MEIRTTVGLLPQLTHFLFNDEDFIPVCSCFLETCKGLTVLICLNATSRSLKPQADDAIVAQDLWFIVTDCSDFLKDWKMGAHMGREYWSRAERLTALRHSGETDSAASVLCALSFRVDPSPAL
jgi:hypothetical protein